MIPNPNNTPAPTLYTPSFSLPHDLNDADERDLVVQQAWNQLRAGNFTPAKDLVRTRAADIDFRPLLNQAVLSGEIAYVQVFLEAVEHQHADNPSLLAAEYVRQMKNAIAVGVVSADQIRKAATVPPCARGIIDRLASRVEPEELAGLFQDPNTGGYPNQVAGAAYAVRALAKSHPERSEEEIETLVFGSARIVGSKPGQPQWVHPVAAILRETKDHHNPVEAAFSASQNWGLPDHWAQALVTESVARLRRGLLAQVPDSGYMQNFLTQAGLTGQGVESLLQKALESDSNPTVALMQLVVAIHQHPQQPSAETLREVFTNTLARAVQQGNVGAIEVLAPFTTEAALNQRLQSLQEKNGGGLTWSEHESNRRGRRWVSGAFARLASAEVAKIDDTPLPKTVTEGSPLGDLNRAATQGMEPGRSSAEIRGFLTLLPPSWQASVVVRAVENGRDDTVRAIAGGLSADAVERTLPRWREPLSQAGWAALDALGSLLPPVWANRLLSVSEEARQRLPYTQARANLANGGPGAALRQRRTEQSHRTLDSGATNTTDPSSNRPRPF